MKGTFYIARSKKSGKYFKLDRDFCHRETTDVFEAAKFSEDKIKHGVLYKFNLHKPEEVEFVKAKMDITVMESTLPHPLTVKSVAETAEGETVEVLHRTTTTGSVLALVSKCGAKFISDFKPDELRNFKQCKSQ